jgi:hypothetical protein
MIMKNLAASVGPRGDGNYDIQASISVDEKAGLGFSEATAMGCLMPYA